MSSAPPHSNSPFYAEWNLRDCRAVPSNKHPAPHQRSALGKLGDWYQSPSSRSGGGILRLPTGAGKTFTAVRFLCTGPLSDGYKVLWLAHTHHLLEQAFESFDANALSHIREPRMALRVRVVSGTPGHFPPRDIRSSDDVLIATLQTITNAHREAHPSYREFIDSAGGKLFVVFDEAHHAPAPSYRKLLLDLREEGATVLGLTATPTYTNEAKRGWLKKLFPQGILAQAKVNDLIAAGILARPRIEQPQTAFAPDFDEAEHQKWLGTYRDVPEHVIDMLASSRERNALIAEQYASNREKYGRTIIFTDRWFQCESIVEALGHRGVRAEAVYSHIDSRPSSVEGRRLRTRDENAKVLARFRDRQFDVLVNVRMLTEGTDLPSVQTVFLTRETTSQILRTQMIGRAMRGPKFNGTSDAYIVQFQDNWQHAMPFADLDPLWDGGTESDDPRSRPKRPPLQLISIDLVKRLARQMSQGVNVTPGPFTSLMPIGWYHVTYDARVEGMDDIEPHDELVMVFDHERAGFEALIAEMLSGLPPGLEDESVKLDANRDYLQSMAERFLMTTGRSERELLPAVFHLARHIGQGQGSPKFFPFEMREDHDLDAIAQDFIERDLGARAIHESLKGEYQRPDRFWRALLPSFGEFGSYYDACQRRQLAKLSGYEPTPLPTPRNPELPSFGEPDEMVKEQVKRRDGGCLACGMTHRRFLEVDHVVPVRVGGSNESSNLQTLCKSCNNKKRARTMRFRVGRTALDAPLSALEHFDAPDDPIDREKWERFLRQTVNFFFQCGAVSSITIGGRGYAYYNWTIELKQGNSPSWLSAHLPSLFERIQEARRFGGKPEIESILVTAPGEEPVRYPSEE